ncbi:MAG: DUF5946 family protein [Bacteroidia bacterium]
MQDFIDQANKNGIALLDSGSCQFCGADYQKGIFDCMDHYNNGLQLLDFDNPEHHISRFLSVDAHALQHPEIHGRWSNHFHLTRIYLILHKGIRWDYKKSPLLSDYLNAFKLKNPNAVLPIPKPLERGKISSKDLTRTTTSNDCIATIKKWADEVYQSWGASHLLISEIAEDFLNYPSKKHIHQGKTKNE